MDNKEQRKHVIPCVWTGLTPNTTFQISW